MSSYGRVVFYRVVIAIDARTGGRDALVLGGQLTATGGEIIVAAVLELAAVPLAGGVRASARRRAELRDAGEEVYAMLGGDARVRYLPLSGPPLGESVAAVARRVDADAVVVGQDVARAPHLEALLGHDRRWAVVIAPYGQRFVAAYEPRRIGWVGSAPYHGDEVTDVVSLESATIEHSQRFDLLVVPAWRLDAHVAREAGCPVIVPPSRATCPPAAASG